LIVRTKLFLDQYLSKSLDTLAKSFFLYVHIFNIMKCYLRVLINKLLVKIAQMSRIEMTILLTRCWNDCRLTNWREQRKGIGRR